MTEKDKKNIYVALANLLTFNCNTCLDKEQMHKILLCTFRLELIEYAEANGYDNVDELWQDIARTLNIKLENSSYVNSIKKCNCVNGICSLC